MGKKPLRPQQPLPMQQPSQGYKPPAQTFQPGQGQNIQLQSPYSNSGDRVPFAQPAGPKTPTARGAPTAAAAGVPQRPPVGAGASIPGAGARGVAAPSAMAPGAGVQGAIRTGGLTVGPNGRGASTPSGPWGQVDALYQDILKSHNDSWAGTEKGIYAQNALNQSRNSEINASMGRNIGGGFWGGQAQVALGTQQNFLNARNEFDRTGRQLQLDYLDKITRRTERQEDREWQAAQTGSEVPTTAPAPEGSVDELLNRQVSGQNAWTGLNQGYNSYGWDRATLDKAKAAAADYYKDTGKWPTGAQLNGYLTTGGWPL